MIRPIPKGQHFVPCLHLRQFIGSQPKGQVWTYNKNTGVKWSTIPEETGKQTHFYSSENEDGAYDTRLELLLAQSESEAAPVYRDMVNGKLPQEQSQEKADFASFLALAYVRTPAVRDDAARLIARNTQILMYAYGSNDAAFDTLFRKIEAERGEALSDDVRNEVRRSMVDPSEFKISVPKERTFMALGASDGLAQLLFQMQWSLVTPLHGFFVTSDNPVVRSVDPRTRHPMYGDLGFRNRTVQVTFPLTPHAGLRLTWENQMASHLQAGRDAVAHWNQTRAFHADQFLYSHVEDKRILHLARSLKGSRPKLTTVGFGPKTFAEVEVPRRWSK